MRPPRKDTSDSARLPTCLVENLVDDIAAVRQVVFPREYDGRNLNQKALVRIGSVIAGQPRTQDM